MYIKQLKFGNWYIWEAEGKKYPMQVDNKTYNLKEVDISNFQPIVISDKILKENGFVITEIGVILDCKLTTDSYNIKIELNKNNNFSTIKIENGWYSYFGLILYVHELQQLLDVCFIKKDITVSVESVN